MSELTLDLGCGTAKTPGAVGLDVVPLEGVDVVGDMSERPYPFAADTFDAVYLNDVIEHLPNTIKTMEEMYRICKPNARVYIRVINWNSRYAAMDPTHVTYFTERTFDFFGKRVGRSYYTRARFDVVQVRRVYNSLAKAVCPNERLLHFFGQFWSNVLDDLHFELRAVKPESLSEQRREAAGAPHAWFSSLRCPVALADGKNGDLELRGNWLICTESGCKYPVKNGVPCISRQYGLKWQNVDVADLPVPAPFPELMPVEDKPIETVGKDDGFREIESVRDLAWELLKTYSLMPFRKVWYAVAGVPAGVLRRAVRGYPRLRNAVARRVRRRSESSDHGETQQRQRRAA